MTVFDLLRADHRQLTQLFDEVRQTSDYSERRSLFEELRDRLEAHSELEEELLYPRLSRKTELIELMTESSEDHRLMREVISELATAYDPDDFEELLDELIDLVEDHVAEEEAEVFPRVLTAMTEGEWQDLYDQMLLRRRESTSLAA